MKNEVVIFSIRISKDMYDKLKSIATENDRSVNYLINKAINEMYEQ